MVTMVSGAASASMYSVSGAAGSLVPVLAQSRRCSLAPAPCNVRHRGDASSLRYALYVRLAMAMPRRLRSSSETLSLTATSQRLTKSEATDPTVGSRPAAIRRSIPRIYASAAAVYCSRENSNVTFIGTPAKISSSIAGMPLRVPGILMKRLARFARA